MLSEKDIQEMIEKLQGQDSPRIARAKFSQLVPVPCPGEPMAINRLGDVRVTLSARLGVTRLTVREVLDLQMDSVVELKKLAGEPVDILINDRLVATGEIVVINEVFGVRVNALAEEQEE